jgi:hypothetical protein
LAHCSTISTSAGQCACADNPPSTQLIGAPRRCVHIIYVPRAGRGGLVCLAAGGEGDIVWDCTALG